MQIIALIGI